MNKGIHSVTGAVAGAGIYVKYQLDNSNKISGRTAGVCAILGLVGGIIPDFLEKPTSSKHRGFFHSWTFFIISLVFLLLILKLKPVKENHKIAIKSFSAGYGSHLALDITTPAGLPII